MEDFSGTAIFWFLTQGMVVGAVFGIYLKKEGVSMLTNIATGILSALICGFIGMTFSLGEGYLFSFIGALACLFLINVFHQHHQEDIYGHIDRGISIHKKEVNRDSLA